MLTIYLDSSDYSVFAEPPPECAEEYSTIFRRLQDLVCSGAIEIRYSAIHISEICNTVPEHLAHARKRVATLDALSAGKCLRFWDDISNEEVDLAIEGKTSQWCRALGHSKQRNDWLPWPIKEIENLRDRFRRDLGEEMKKRGIPRRQRTKKAIDRLVRDFARSPVGAARLKESAKAFYEELPIRASPKLSEAFERFALGTISEFELKRTVVEAASDPLDLISHLAPRLQAEGKLSSLVRNIGSQMESASKEQFKKILEFAELSVRLDRVEDAKAQFRSMFGDLRRRLKIQLIRSQLLERTGRSRKGPISDDEIAKLPVPNVDVIVNAWTRKLWGLSSDVLGSRKLRHWEMQDTADLMHARYAPYTDVFRCDSRWSSAISESNKPYRTRVVAKLRDLIPAIEMELRNAC